MKKFLALAVLIFASCGMSMAWNCSTPGQVRVQVPTGTLGNGTGDGSGQVVVDAGLTFICEALPTAVTTPPNATSASNSTSGANSNSTSGASATGGNSSSTANGGSSTSNSGVNNSGNSSNKNTLSNTNTLSNNLANTNTLSNTQKQSQTQSNTSTNNNASTATSNGDNSNNTTEVTNIKPAASAAYAPTSLPSAPCTKSFGAGVSSVPGGLSFGGNKVDAGCDARELARSYSLTGSRIAACKVLIATKRSKQAGVTLDDCMQQPELQVVVTPPVVVAAPVVAPVPQVVIIQVPVPEPSHFVSLEEPVVVKVAPKAQSHKRVYTNGKPCKVPDSLYQLVPQEK